MKPFKHVLFSLFVTAAAIYTIEFIVCNSQKVQPALDLNDRTKPGLPGGSS